MFVCLLVFDFVSIELLFVVSCFCLLLIVLLVLFVSFACVNACVCLLCLSLLRFGLFPSLYFLSTLGLYFFHPSSQSVRQSVRLIVFSLFVVLPFFRRVLLLLCFFVFGWLAGWLLGLGWVGLGWVGLGWVGLGWSGLGWAGLGWVGLGWVACLFVGLFLCVVAYLGVCVFAGLLACLLPCLGACVPACLRMLASLLAHAC